jgi:serine/threonine-protein kinase
VTQVPQDLQDALADRYRIERELGGGGMATVYLAEDLKHHRPVAIKVLHPELGAAIGPERFLREIAIAARLNHPRILPLHDSGAARGFLYYVMPHVEGESVRQRLERERQLPLAEALRIAREVAEALDYAHGQGVVHRDVKPENILLSRGHAVVADFGIARAVGATGGAKLTETGVVPGTPLYMSPEQAAGDSRIDGRSDQYSLACVLYEMLGGQPPFTGPSAESIVHQHLNVAPRPVRDLRPSVPRELDAVLTRALAKTPADRFSSAGEFASALAAADRAVTGEGRTSRSRSRRRAGVLVGGLLALVVVAVATFWVLRGRIVGSRPGATPRITSLAVLPFVNLSGSSQYDYLSDGVTEELINALDRLPDLKVVSRTSAFAFKGKNVDVREIAGKLAVDAVLEGSCRAGAGRLRLSARLISARDGYDLWSDSYETELTDVLDVQNRIATAVAQGLRARLTGRPLVKGSTSDLQAYELYLKGRQSAQYWTRAGMDDAIAYFREAIERDSSFAQAHAGLADVYSVMDHRPGLTSLPPAETYRLAEESARRALAIDPNSAEAHAALGHIQGHRGEFREAEQNLRRALELNPNAATTRLWYAVMLRALQRLPEAKEQFLRARELDPLSVMVSQMAALNLWLGGDFAATVDFAQRGLRTAPEYGELDIALARAHACLGRFAEAQEEIQRAATAPQGTSYVEEERAMVLAIAGRRSEALALLRRIERDKREPYAPSLIRAYAASGELGRAVETLEAFARRDPFFARNNVDSPPHPAFAALRAHPRYQEVRRKLGLPPLR